MVAGLWLLSNLSRGDKVTVINKVTFLKGVGPAGACFALSLGFSNLGISFTNAHFYEMIESSTVLGTASIACLMGKAIPKVLWIPLLGSVVGFSLCWTGEPKFSMMGFIFLLLGVLFRCTKTMLN